MPRAYRYFIPGYTWHITHRCHKQEFLLKFVCDRKKWIRCLVYIDMNMVRAGVAKHPHDWATGGYHEIQNPRQRYSIIDHNYLAQSLGYSSIPAFQEHHRRWIDEALEENKLMREAKWSQSIAVGSETFVNQVADAINPELSKRKTTVMGESYVVRDAYNAHSNSKMGPLSLKNTVPWKVSL